MGNMEIGPSETTNHKNHDDGYISAAYESFPENPPTFFFSFGTSEIYPFQNGWVEVRADDAKQAEALFRSHFPDKHPGTLNCAFVYNEREWRQTPMASGVPGQSCHRVISEPGPFRKDALKDRLFSELVDKAKGRIARRFPRHGKAGSTTRDELER